MPDVLDEPGHALEPGERIVLEPVRQREVEHQLGVGRALDPGEETGVDGEQQVAPQSLVVLDEAVVHEEPAAMAERVAVRLLDRGPGRGPDVGQEERRGDPRRDLMQVAVAPRGRDAAVQARGLVVAVPAQPEAVRVGVAAGEAVAAALLDERVRRVVQERRRPDRVARVRHPAAHIGQPNRAHEASSGGPQGNAAPRTRRDNSATELLCRACRRTHHRSRRRSPPT